jgi:hypothetical protein
MSIFDGVRTHTLYLSSKHRDDNETPWSLTFDLPNSCIYLDDPVAQTLKVSLASFSFACAWSEVTSDNNHFRVGGVDVVLEEGNWPFPMLATAITKALQLDPLHPLYQQSGGAVCKYDLPSGKLIFTGVLAAPSPEPSAFTLEFVNSAWTTLGFASPTTVSSVGGLIISATPLAPRRTTDLFVRLNNVTQGDGNLNFSNFRGKLLAPTAVLCPIPILVAPYTHQHCDLSVMGPLLGVFVSNEKLNQLEIDIVDEDGNLATYISEWTATIKVQVMPVRDETLEHMRTTMEQVRELLQHLLTLKVVGRPNF